MVYSSGANKGDSSHTMGTTPREVDGALETNLQGSTTTLASTAASAETGTTAVSASDDGGSAGTGAATGHEASSSGAHVVAEEERPDSKITRWDAAKGANVEVTEAELEEAAGHNSRESTAARSVDAV